MTAHVVAFAYPSASQEDPQLGRHVDWRSLSSTTPTRRRTINFACAELIRFEFRCREDQDEFKTDFESIVQKFSRDDPVEMRKRLANVCKATERVDARVTGLLQTLCVVRFPEQRCNAVV